MDSWNEAHQRGQEVSRQLAALGCTIERPVHGIEYEVDAAYAGRWMAYGLMIDPAALTWLVERAAQPSGLSPARSATATTEGPNDA